MIQWGPSIFQYKWRQVRTFAMLRWAIIIISFPAWFMWLCFYQAICFLCDFIDWCLTGRWPEEIRDG